jgi:DNA-binding GntR family transcriptional regulator
MAIFAALKARDAEGAEAAMRTHLTRQREALRQLVRQHKSRIAVVNTEHDKLGIAT